MPQMYDDLYILYETSDVDNYYDMDGSVMDIYSEDPTGADPYNYFYNNGRQCGNYNSENDCYNREHLYPQGFFNSQEPMRSDAHHVIPTDGFVNNGRGNLPFGEVQNVDDTYQNGSRRGSSATTGFSGDVFEPIDEFKGDVARSILYFAVRYESQYNNNSWDDPSDMNDPRNGTQGQYYEQWFIDQMLAWHNADPVDQREIDRNNAIFNFQGNRNPFIDNPAYADQIWNPTASTPSIATVGIKIWPNPSSGVFHVSTGAAGLKTIQIFDLQGRLVKQVEAADAFTLSNPGLYFVLLDTTRGQVQEKVVVN